MPMAAVSRRWRARAALLLGPASGAAGVWATNANVTRGLFHLLRPLNGAERFRNRLRRVIAQRDDGVRAWLVSQCALYHAGPPFRTALSSGAIALALRFPTNPHSNRAPSDYSAPPETSWSDEDPQSCSFVPQAAPIHAAHAAQRDRALPAPVP